MEDKVTEGVLLKLRDIKEETLQELQDALSLLLSYDILANDSGVQRSVTKKTLLTIEHGQIYEGRNYT